MSNSRHYTILLSENQGFWLTQVVVNSEGALSNIWIKPIELVLVAQLLSQLSVENQDRYLRKKHPELLPTEEDYTP